MRPDCVATKASSRAPSGELAAMPLAPPGMGQVLSSTGGRKFTPSGADHRTSGPPLEKGPPWPTANTCAAFPT